MAVYGVTWASGSSGSVLTRTQSNNPAWSQTQASAALNNVTPWQLRRCNVWPSNGKVTAYINDINASTHRDRCYTDTDVTNMGNVMVEMPKFWHAIDVTDVGHGGHVGFYISDTGTETVANLYGGGNITWTVHPAFKVVPAAGGAAVEVANAYIGAFEAYQTGSVLQSVSGVTPTTSTSIVNFRTYAENYPGWHMATIQVYNALRELFIIEYATLSSQTALGSGYVNVALQNTGGSAALGNASWGVSDYIHVMSYRGVENLWGNANAVVEGVNVGNPNYRVWVAPQTNVASAYSGYKYTSPYVDTTMSVTSTSSAYISAINTTAYSWAFLPSAAAGAPTTYFCDYNYAATGDNVLLYGGQYAGNTTAGLFFTQSVAYNYAGGASTGTRIQYMPEA